MESWYENGNKYSETIQNPNAKEDEITKEQNSWKENGKWSHGLYWRKKWRKNSSAKNPMTKYTLILMKK